LVSGFAGWAAGVYLYFGILLAAGEDPVGGIHIGALVLGLMGMVLVPFWLRRSLPERLGGRRSDLRQRGSGP